MYYDDIYRLGEQIVRAYDQVTESQVKVIFLEDMKQEPANVFKGVLRFLGVSDYDKRVFPVLNKSKTHRSAALQHSLGSLGTLKRAAKLKNETGLLAPFYALNTKEKKRASLEPEFLHVLQEYFRENIIKLSELTNRNLSRCINGPSH